MLNASFTVQRLTTYLRRQPYHAIPVQAAVKVGFAEEAFELSKMRLRRAAIHARRVVRGKSQRGVGAGRM
jgi:hypothetical protein